MFLFNGLSAAVDDPVLVPFVLPLEATGFMITVAATRLRVPTGLEAILSTQGPYITGTYVL